MSIFIGNLSYENVSLEFIKDNKLGVLTGSVISAILGYAYLRFPARNVKRL